MNATQMFTATAGDTRDDEGFRIITSSSTMYAHAGEVATIWMPGRRYATSMSALVTLWGHVTVSRDGKGDTLTFDLAAASGQSVVVKRGGEKVAELYIYSDGQSGCFADMSGNPYMFASLPEAILLMGSCFII